MLEPVPVRQCTGASALDLYRMLQPVSGCQSTDASTLVAKYNRKISHLAEVCSLLPHTFCQECRILSASTNIEGVTCMHGVKPHINEQKPKQKKKKKGGETRFCTRTFSFLAEPPFPLLPVWSL